MSDIEKMPLRSMGVAAERIEKLKAIFPEVFMEGKVDHDALLRSLGQWVEPGKERFGLNWPGKAECMKVIQIPSVGTLLPMRDDSVNFDTTENLIIEGDNLEALKLLQKSYFGKVKMIYIDPPYNTGGEFIYPDNYREGLQEYLQYSGQVDAEGYKLSSNSETDGRFHSRWLSMMYSRLFVARNLLREDGAIFVSIDDNELHNLKAMMNEIFGEENFIGSFVWRRRASSALAERLVSTDHEYVLCFQKNDFVSLGVPKSYGAYSNPDNDPRGDWTTGDLTVGMNKEMRPNQFYDLVDPKTGNIFPANPNRVWAYVPESMQKLLDEDRVIFPDDTSRRPMLKRFKSNLKSDVNPASTWLSDVPLNSEATRQMQELMGTNIFAYPKPTALINELIKATAKDDDIVLDFFAGSGTTAHSVLELNKSDGGNRKFIVVQLPEKIDNPEYPTITHITRERVRRIIKKLNEADEGKLDLDGSAKQDRGFKSLKLSSSNFKVWEGDAEKVADINATLSLFAENIVFGRSSEDILYELLLKAGFPLTASVEKLSLAGKEVFSIAEGALLICLDKELTLEVIEAMVEREPSQILCLDEGFKRNDQLKVNVVQTVKARNRNEESDIVFRVV